MVEWRKNWSTTATFICKWYLQVKGNVDAWLKTKKGIVETETVFWCFISAASESSAWKIGDFTRVKWSHGDMLLVSKSIFSRALRLIIGLEEWVSFSSLSCWMDALMVACWKAGMLETGSKSHSECHLSPKGKEKKTWGHQRRTEWVISVHGGWTVCVCVYTWRHVVTLHFSCWLLSIKHRLASHSFKAAWGSKFYYWKLHHTVNSNLSAMRAS